MSDTNNKDLARQYFAEVWNVPDPANEAVLRRFLSPSFLKHLSPTAPPLDLEGQLARLAGIKAAFPNITITAEEIISEDDKVVIRGTLRGTHLGEFMGLAPTGRDVVVEVVDVIRVEGGRFAEGWGGPNVFDILRQLGATFAAGD